MKKWNRLIALGMISFVLTAQAAGCGSKQEEESSLLDMTERDKEMEELAENSSGSGDAESSENGLEPGVTGSSEGENEGESSSEPDIIPWEEAGLEDHVMDWKGQDEIEHEMRIKTGIMEGDLMLSDVWEVTQIELGGSRWGWTDDLSPLVELENLTMLTLRSSLILEYYDISELKQLKKLFIPGIGLKDGEIDFLSELTNLTDLDLSENEISDLTPLSELKNLEHLNLRSNQITDVSPLAELTNLKDLDLYYNEGITDYSPVSFVEWVHHN